MKKTFQFGIGLIRLLAGANWQQVFIHEKDHNQAYQGTKIPLQLTHSCTWRCNYNCKHCQSENDNAKIDATKEEIIKIIDEGCQMSTVKIGFTGGEPLVRKDMCDILDYCYKKKLITTMVSNGALVPKFIDRLKKLNLLFMSLDGDQQAHDDLRGKGKWDILVRAIESAKAQNISVCALSTIGSYNINCLENMNRFVNEQNIHWMIGLIQTQYTGKTEQDISHEQIEQTVRILKKSPQLRTTHRYLNFIQSQKPPSFCFAGIGYAIITPDLTLYPCFPAQFDPAYQGISLKNKSLQDAFKELPLYRNDCRTCRLACHMEANYLYCFDPGSIMGSLKLC
jgi:MoaA/NifB/PqqE/SkfB family radical SAM enzyme